MTPADRNDLVTSQEKLEWVTPKISLMRTEDVEAKERYKAIETFSVGGGDQGGPS
mgnify:CR=1 FL=1